MDSVYDQILAIITKGKKGSVYIPKDFLDIADRVNIDKALSHLAKNNVIRRLSQGLYDYPRTDAKLGELPPDIDQVLDAITRRSGHTLQVNGAKAANLLGLSTQVPAQLIYLTDGYTRNIKIGNWVIQLKHASPKVLAGAGQMAGYVLQALRYLGSQNINIAVINKIKTRLSSQDKKQLKQMIHVAPGWATDTILVITEGI